MQIRQGNAAPTVLFNSTLAITFNNLTVYLLCLELKQSVLGALACHSGKLGTINVGQA